MTEAEMIAELLNVFDGVEFRKRGSVYQVVLTLSDRGAEVFGGPTIAAALRNAISMTLG